MRLHNVLKNKNTIRDNHPAGCIIIFLQAFIPLVLASFFIRTYNTLLFHLILFFTGWFTWTFLEYMAHKYLMHQKHREKPSLDFNHLYHHTHPTDIQISALQRWVLLAGSIILIFLSVWLNNYFTIAAGLLCGFPGYTVIHFLLHQKKMQQFFKKMVSYHIYHHCKYSDKCFGISVTWWDDILGTAPPANGMISQRVIDFYFKNNTKDH